MPESNKISIVVLSDKREQLQMAAMVASVAVTGNQVFAFLSKNISSQKFGSASGG